MSRGEGILPYSIEEIFEIIEKVEKRGDYDSLFDSVIKNNLFLGLHVEKTWSRYRHCVLKIQNNKNCC